MKVQFADCVLDVDARTVCRETAAIHLSPKAFELLAALIEHRGRALSKSELLERVWPNVFVSDASLARVVKEIRQALVVGVICNRVGRLITRSEDTFDEEFEIPVEQRAQRCVEDRDLLAIIKRDITEDPRRNGYAFGTIWVGGLILFVEEFRPRLIIKEIREFLENGHGKGMQRP